MNKMFFKIGLGVLALAGLAWPSRGAAAEMKTLSGHVPAATANLAKTGDYAATNEMHLAIGLPLRNQTNLDSLITQLSDPSSPNYRHYLSPQEFARQFGPTEADYQAVIDFAQGQGLTVTAIHSNRMLLEVKGQASVVQHAFNVSLHTYQHPTENRTFYAPDTEPQVPASLAMLDISGLNNYSRPHSFLKLHSVANASQAPHSGSGMNGSYMGGDFRAAYVPGTSLTGAGQNVALVQFDGYLATDIQLYESLCGLPNVALTNILLNGFSGFPTGTGGEVEVSLDLEMVISMAPGVNQIRVYEGDPFNFIPNVVLNQIAVDDAAQQVSCSWGWGGGPNATSDQIFKEMILQGQTFYNASGDSDAFLPGQVDNPGYPGFPSSDPFITEVGATTLTTTGPGGSFVSETVWNWDVEFGPQNDGVGSSGGISSHYAIPAWQTNVSMTANGGSTTYRNIPDVALTGDNVLVIADGGLYYPGTGGTSCAAPLWAGFTALINQQAASQGVSPVGFINPAIYALASSSTKYSNAFRDVTTGSNTWSSSPTLFVAVTNYDLCTGLGSPNGTNLINALLSTNVVSTGSYLIPPPVQPWGNTLNNLIGTDPNGFWMLYVQDESAIYGGTNYNGWYVTLTSATPVAGYADNEMSINVTNLSLAVGSQWTAVLTLTNYGPSVSQGVVVADQLPGQPDVTLVSSSTSMAGSSVTVYGNTLTWVVGSLATNAGGTLTLTFQGNAAGTYTNGASVSATTTDPNTDNNSVGLLATVSSFIPQPQLVPFLGSTGGFRLSVTNDANYTVVIQASTNLITWQSIATNVAPFTYTNLDSTYFPQRFYRAVVGQ